MFTNDYLIASLFLLPILINIVILLFLLPGLLFKEKHYKKMVKEKKVTVLLPTYNDKEGVILALESLENQQSKHHIQVIIVNDGSTDSTGDMIDFWLSNGYKNHKYRHIKLEKNTGLKGRAINQVTDLISEDSEVVVVMDGDTILEKNALRHCIDKLYSHENIGAVCGMVIPQLNGLKTFSGRLQQCELIGAFHSMKSAQCRMGSIGSLAGALTVHKMTTIKDVGWYGDWLVEDICWTWKAKAKGWKLGFSEDSLAFTDCPENMEKLWRQRRRWSRGRLEALKVAFMENNTNAITILPWFIYSIMQMLSIPGLIVAILFKPLLALVIVIILCLLHWYYAYFNIRGLAHYAQNISPLESAIWTSLLIDLFLFIPNTCGFFDEVRKKEKAWLTR